MTAPHTVAGHTAGPWHVDDAGDIVSGPYNVCIPYATKPEDKQLMAAAPDLLAALVALVPADFDEHPGDFTEEWHAARAAIAKATAARQSGEDA